MGQTGRLWGEDMDHVGGQSCRDIHLMDCVTIGIAGLTFLERNLSHAPENDGRKEELWSEVGRQED